MKKLLLFMAAGLTALTAAADWGTTPATALDVFPTGTTSYGTDFQQTPDGGVWAMIYHPNAENASGETDIPNVVYEYRVQYWDKEGNPKFPPEGLLVSNFKNKSYTVVNNYLSCDAEGNLLVAVLDCRNSAEMAGSYTAYLISPEGEMLWGDEGKPVSDEMNPGDFEAMVSVVPLDDGSFVFSWIESSNEGDTNVMLQRLDKNGNKKWDMKSVSLIDDNYSNPYLIPSDDNCCILVFSRTASQVIYARKIDFEGENVWGKDTRVYRGGWGSIPIHTLISVVPSGNGGALISWNDDRAMTNYESPYLSYITSDGKLGFAGASDEGDVKLGYSGWRCFMTKAVPAADGSCFYAAWRETNMGQSLQGMRIQKISLDGELLWDDEGVNYVPMDEQSVGYLSIQPAGENDFTVFYEIYYEYFNQVGYATRFNPEAEPVWAVSLTEDNRKASGLESMTIDSNNAWLYAWVDSAPEAGAPSTEKIARLNGDGTFGVPDSGITTINYSNENICFNGRELIADADYATIYNAAGMVVSEVTFTDHKAAISLPEGIYIAKTNNNSIIKLMVK